ncbi:hypothetical protein GOP47_0018669 [Adiantum capillus-veneris]|uniref:RCC1-like domain-containing protein n=1 Tax=Adiantum capillus-veneris TaxID=13818 RepID=A0A9D4UDZ9_ADICA|nr:hypothetical protein GOP47_0018669 [Adiantum capillus-veneris]
MEGSGGGEQGGEWWSWGAGTHGQLGTGAFQDELLPQRLPPPSPAPLLQLACGGSHSVAVLRNGEAMTWGNNSSGQLGRGDSESSCEPTLVKELHCLKVHTVSAGWSHTAFISDDYSLFTCGSGGYGQLGHGNFDSCSVPRRVICFASMKVFLAACGMRHTLVLVGSALLCDADEEGTSVYAFGSSKKGQLGLGSLGGVMSVKGLLNTHHTPSLVGSLVGCNVSSIHASGDHSAALSDHGNLFVWGRGFDTRSNFPVPLKVLSGLSFAQVALGWSHLLALTCDGQVYAIGSRHRFGTLSGCGALTSEDNGGSKSTEALNEQRGCAASTQASAVCVKQFEPLKGHFVRWVAAGSEHSAAVLKDGSVVTWGWGEHGQLGLGNTTDHSCPNIVLGVPRMVNSQVYCGCGFSFLCQSCT